MTQCRDFPQRIRAVSLLAVVLSVLLAGVVSMTACASSASSQGLVVELSKVHGIIQIDPAVLTERTQRLRIHVSTAGSDIVRAQLCLQSSSTFRFRETVDGSTALCGINEWCEVILETTIDKPAEAALSITVFQRDSVLAADGAVVSVPYVPDLSSEPSIVCRVNEAKIFASCPAILSVGDTVQLAVRNQNEVRYTYSGTSTSCVKQIGAARFGKLKLRAVGSGKFRVQAAVQNGIYRAKMLVQHFTIVPAL